MKTFLMFLLFSLVSEAGELCSPLSHCRLTKKRYGAKGWQELVAKELKIPKLCGSERPQLQLEKDLGLEIWIFPGDGKAEKAVEKAPYVNINLHTTKLTNVIFSVDVPLETKSVSFTHRLSSKGPVIVEVSCY